MTEKLADDASPTIRGASLQSIASSMKESVTATMKDAVSSAHTKAVAQEAKNAAQSSVKGLQTTLQSLRDGTKSSAGIKKVPQVLAAQSHTEEVATAVDAALHTSQTGLVRERNAFTDREATLRHVYDVVEQDRLILSTVWHKLMSPGDRSRRASQIRED